MRKQSCVARSGGTTQRSTANSLTMRLAYSVQTCSSLARPGFRVVMYDTIEEFYLAEALEYIEAWKQSTPDNPAGICGPIGPTEQLPLVARWSTPWS